MGWMDRILDMSEIFRMIALEVHNVDLSVCMNRSDIMCDDTVGSSINMSCHVTVCHIPSRSLIKRNIYKKL